MVMNVMTERRNTWSALMWWNVTPVHPPTPYHLPLNRTNIPGVWIHPTQLPISIFPGKYYHKKERKGKKKKKSDATTINTLKLNSTHHHQIQMLLVSLEESTTTTAATFGLVFLLVAPRCRERLA